MNVFRCLINLGGNNGRAWSKSRCLVLNRANLWQTAFSIKMAFPKTARLRKISVDGVIYRWRATFGELQGTLSIYGPESSGQVLHIRSQHWFDMWLSYFFALKKAPVLVSPSLVRAAIEFGLANDWNPQTRRRAQIFEYLDGQFVPLGTTGKPARHPHF